MCVINAENLLIKVEKEKYSTEERLLVEFMGYTYYAPSVLIDYSECGGLYTSFEVFSKVPIDIDDYGDEVYFKKLPNPDFKNENPKHWENYIDELAWDILNRDKYLLEIEYKKSLDALYTVWEKFRDLEIVTEYKMLHNNYCARIAQDMAYNRENLFNQVVNAVKWYNSIKTKQWK